MNLYSRMLVVAAVAGAAVAQDGAYSHHLRGKPTDVIGQATGVGMQDGGLWATGPRYKADFNAAGVRFTPALGERAPHNMPLALSLRSIRRGGLLVHEAATGTAPRQVEQAIVYDRGGIQERYEPRPEGLEQSFVFERPIRGDGDLVVRCQLDTELQPQVRADGTLGFVLAEVGGVRIGKVIGIDALGARADGAMRLDGSTLELVLPSAFVDTAHFPLVLDPLIGADFLVYSTYDSYESDVAFDVTTSRYLVVWNVRWSFLDLDVYGIRVGITGSIVGSALGIDTSLGTVGHPRVAGINSTDRFLVVWQRANSPFEQSDISCRAVNAADGAMSAIVQVTATAANEWNPVVGGDATTTDDDAVVVWQTPVASTTSGLKACQVTVAAGVDPVPFAPVILTGSGYSDTPAITKACGATGYHLITWSGAVLTSILVEAQLVTRDLALVGLPVPVSSNFGLGLNTHPAVDGDGASYMVAWERGESSGTTKDIVCARLSASGAGLSLAQAETPVEATAGEDEYGPDIAYLGGRFCITYAERTGALADDCFAVLVNPDCSTCNAKMRLDGLNGPNWNRESGPRLAATWIHDNTRDDALITFSEARDQPPFQSRIIGQRIESLGPGVAPLNVAGGCGRGGDASTAGGPFVIGNTAFTFTLDNADPAAVLFLSIGFPGTGLSCGTCTLTNPVSFLFQLNASGRASSPFPITCDPQFVGLPIEFQWVSFNTAFSPCPFAASLSASHRIRVTVGS